MARPQSRSRGQARALLTPLPALGAATHRSPGPISQLRALPTEGGLLDATLNWLLLDCTVVAVQDTEEVAEEVAITTLFASMKASWKLYKHFFFAAFFFSLQSETAAVSLLAGGGRASGLVSESVGPSMSLPEIVSGKKVPGLQLLSFITSDPQRLINLELFHSGVVPKQLG